MINAFSFSEVGGHRVNEDAFGVHLHPQDSNVWLCFVADGHGGQAGGGRAAELACQSAMTVATKLQPEQLKDQRAWIGLLREVDEAIRLDDIAGSTTFIGLCVIGNRVLGVSHGDSAALLVNGEETIKLTYSQHKNPPVGSGSASPVPFAANVKESWRLLLMTDGVWKYVGWGKVVDAAKRLTGNELIAELQQAARLPGSGSFQDDFTVVLIEETGAEK